ncbi:MAG TPA: hypothetical protein VN493_26100 [Thermoanaerobaculia bacterium]|nr:hypothetical protein [Thermoanaerobaculia bacterium]
MSPLASDVKDAIVDAAGNAVPGGMPAGRWSGLSGAVRDLIYAKVAERLMEVDNGTVSSALLDALADGRLERDEIKGALLTAAAERAGGTEVAALLREALEAGPLNRQTAIRVIVAWGQSRIQDEALRSLFGELAGIVGSGSGLNAEEILDRVLRASTIDPAIAGRVLGAVRDGRLDASEIVFLLTALAAAAGGTASLAGAGSPLAKAEAVLQAGLPKGAEALLRKTLDEDWLGVLSAMLGSLEAGVGGSLLRRLLGGELRGRAVSKLTELLEKAGLDEAGTVADAIVDIASGARGLFAEGEDADSGLEKPAELALWREVRQAFYMAQLATFGGPLVPTGAMDRPHIFAAAAIRFLTPLHSLVPEDADDLTKRRYCNAVTASLDQQLRPRLEPTFAADGVLAVTPTDLRPDSSAVVGDVFEGLFLRLRSA